jgi:NADPH:quinone reductase-like Zn-dependent oxidoreductase
MSTPTTMRALRQTSLNGPEDLGLVTDAPVPTPGPGEILVRVTAAGVNFVDVSQAHGTFAGGPQPPYVAGIEGAGEVIAVGEGVTDQSLALASSGSASAAAPSPSTWCFPRSRRSRCPRAGRQSRRWVSS